MCTKTRLPQKTLHVSSRDTFEKSDLLGEITKCTKLTRPPTHTYVFGEIDEIWCTSGPHQICMTKYRVCRVIATWFFGVVLFLRYIFFYSTESVLYGFV
jgi:hypothetical protein